MSTLAQKTQYLGQVQAAMTAVADLNETTKTLTRIFIERGYDPAAADPITVSDLNPFGVGTYEMGNAVNLFQALALLCAGSASGANAAAPSTLAKWRLSAPSAGLAFSTKLVYISNAQTALTLIAEQGERAAMLAQLYSHRAYDGAAADPIIQAELDSFGVVPYDLGIAVNLLAAFGGMVNGSAVSANAAFPSVISKWRQV